MSLLLDALKRAEAARHDTAPVLSLATDLPVAAPNDLPLPPLAGMISTARSHQAAIFAPGAPSSRAG